MKYYYEMTKHPKLFKDTYWGGCSIADGGIDGQEHIFKNRDMLVEMHDLKKLLPKPNVGFRELTIFDHIELYSTDNGYLLLTSPYTSFALYENLSITGLAGIGNHYPVISIPPVYRDTASSFVIHIPPGRAELNRFKRRIENEHLPIKDW